MSEYKEVPYVFSGLDPFVVDSESLIEQPYRDDAEGVFIEAQILETLDDGKKLELCLWTDCELGLTFWDVSADKTLFDGKGKEDFLAWLREKGLYLENVKDRWGGRWQYCGVIPKKDVYRIQYCEMPDRDEDD